MQIALVISGIVAGALAGSPPSPEPASARTPDLSPGDRFDLEIRYSDRWSLEAFARRPRKAAARRSPAPPPAAEGGSRPGTSISRPGAPAGTDVAAPKTSGSSSTPAGHPVGKRVDVILAEPLPLRAATAARDPLFATLRLEGEVREGGALALCLRVSEVRYTDYHGTSWTLQPSKPECRESAERIAAALKPSLYGESLGSLERRMIEEQFLGLSLACLDGETLDLQLEAVASQSPLGDLDAVLEARLPPSCPKHLYHQVTEFLGEAIARMVPPRPERWRAGVNFESRGLRYTVESMSERDGRSTGRIFAKAYDPRSGLGVKDKAVVDLATGLPLSRTFVRHQDSIHSQNVFFSWKQWEVSLRSLRRAPRGQ